MTMVIRTDNELVVGECVIDEVQVRGGAKDVFGYRITVRGRSEPLYSEHVTLGTIVPATYPAYRFWMEIDDRGNESFYRLPIVAWQVSMDAFERRYTNVEPITEYFEGEVPANSASMVIYNKLPAEEYLR